MLEMQVETQAELDLIGRLEKWDACLGLLL
jgi:hypothetical protein